MSVRLVIPGHEERRGVEFVSRLSSTVERCGVDDCAGRHDCRRTLSHVSTCKYCMSAGVSAKSLKFLCW